MDDAQEQTSTENNLYEIQSKIKEYYDKIERFFILKQNILEEYKFSSIDDVLRNAPKYYGIVKILEDIYSFVSKDPEWLKNFVESNNIGFEWDDYKLWKSGKDFYKGKYDDTHCPSLWIQAILEKLVDLLKMLQILLYAEFYITEEQFKTFLRKNPAIDFKIKANYTIKSVPSENLDVFFKLISYLMDICIKNTLSSTYVVDTTLCMEVYREIDRSEIFALLKKKDFFVKYRLEFLRLTPTSGRTELPCEDDIKTVAEQFLELYKDACFTYSEYKNRLIEKYNKIKSRIKY